MNLNHVFSRLYLNQFSCFCFASYKVISTPNREATLYIQQTEENEKYRCELAMRKITVATITGQGSDGTLIIQHYHLGRKGFYLFWRLCDVTSYVFAFQHLFRFSS